MVHLILDRQPIGMMNVFWTKEQVELLVKLTKEGWNDEMIAHAVRKSAEQVRAKMAELQVKTPFC